jgi:hypothetical protein
MNTLADCDLPMPHVDSCNGLAVLGVKETVRSMSL